MDAQTTYGLARDFVGAAMLVYLIYRQRRNAMSATDDLAAISTTLDGIESTEATLAADIQKLIDATPATVDLAPTLARLQAFATKLQGDVTEAESVNTTAPTSEPTSTPDAPIPGVVS